MDMNYIPPHLPEKDQKNVYDEVITINVVIFGDEMRPLGGIRVR